MVYIEYRESCGSPASNSENGRRLWRSLLSASTLASLGIAKAAVEAALNYIEAPARKVDIAAAAHGG